MEAHYDEGLGDMERFDRLDFQNMADLSTRISQVLAELRDFDVAQLNCEHHWDDTDGPCPLCHPASFSDLGNDPSGSTDNRDTSLLSHQESSASSNHGDDSVMNNHTRAILEAEPEPRQEHEPFPLPPPPQPHFRPRQRQPPPFHVQEFNAYMEPQPERRPRPLSPAEKLSRKRKRGKVCDTCRARKERCSHVTHGCPWANGNPDSSIGLIRWLVHLLCIWYLCPRVDAVFTSQDFIITLERLQRDCFSILHSSFIISYFKAPSYAIGATIHQPGILQQRPSTVQLWFAIPEDTTPAWMESRLVENPDLDSIKPYDNVSAPTIWRRKLSVFTSHGRGSAWQTMRYHGHRLGPIDPVTSEALRTTM